MKRFRNFAIATAVVTYILILIGSYVKAIHAGMACPSWPSCDPAQGGFAAWVPDFTAVAGFTAHQVMAEWVHRLLAMVTGFMILAEAVWAWREHREHRGLVTSTSLALFLLPTQVVLGGLTVRSVLEPVIVVAHLGIATLIFGAVLVAALLSWLIAKAEPHTEPDAAPAAAAAAAHGTDPADQGEGDGQPTGVRGLLSDLVELTKPGILFLLVITGFSAMMVARGDPWVPLDLIFWTLFGGGLAAAGASVLNNYLDRDVDELMYRTRDRALPDGRVEPWHALVFGIVLSAASMVVLVRQVNWMAAILSLGGLLFYVVVYTLWLKRNTSQNIVIGGAAGCFPALVGWAAVTGDVALPALLLGSFVFLWTPPHFWALALVYRNDYERADLPMMPVARGEEETKRGVFVYSVLLVAATLLLVWPLDVLGAVYLVLASILGAAFLWLAWRVWRDFTPQVSYRLFWYSIIYLGALYVAMGVDRAVPLALF